MGQFYFKAKQSPTFTIPSFIRSFSACSFVPALRRRFELEESLTLLLRSTDVAPAIYRLHSDCQHSKKINIGVRDLKESLPVDNNSNNKWSGAYLSACVSFFSSAQRPPCRCSPAAAGPTSAASSSTPPARTTTATSPREDDCPIWAPIDDSPLSTANSSPAMRTDSARRSS